MNEETIKEIEKQIEEICIKKQQAVKDQKFEDACDFRIKEKELLKKNLNILKV